LNDLNHPDYDDSLPTPDVIHTDEPDPNPQDGRLFDGPAAGDLVHAEGAVDESGTMLDADGKPVPPKVRDDADAQGGDA
jgi:hypothetical protein